MILHIRTNNGIKLVETWLAQEECKVGDIVFYQSGVKMIDNIGPLLRGQTLVTDLDGAQEDIFSAFAKTIRYEIRRAEKENIITEIFESDRITDSYLDSYADFFERFHRSKGMLNEKRGIFISRLKSFRSNHNLVITEARHDNEVLVHHVYITDQDTVCLYQSCSLFREGGDKNRIGRANKLLHWKDILYFKEGGFKKYDWGGFNTEREDVRSISSFKAAFGGRPEARYYTNGGVSRTLKGKAASLFLRMKNRFLSRR